MYSLCFIHYGLSSATVNYCIARIIIFVDRILANWIKFYKLVEEKDALYSNVLGTCESLLQSCHCFWVKELLPVASWSVNTTWLGKCVSTIYNWACFGDVNFDVLELDCIRQIFYLQLVLKAIRWIFVLQNI